MIEKDDYAICVLAKVWAPNGSRIRGSITDWGLGGDRAAEAAAAGVRPAPSKSPRGA
jgi:hypothetical protein